MKKLTVLGLCLFALSLAGTAFGDRIAKKSDENSTVWRVYGSLLKHPDDVYLFTYNDIFVLQLKELPNDKVIIKFKPVEMKNPEWKKFKTNGLDFNIYEQGEIEYYCATQEFKHEKKGSNHMIVISPLSGHEGENIAIQFTDLTGEVSDDICENVTLPSHGGLAHAHAVR